MNFTVYAVECAMCIILFTAVIVFSLCQNPVWWIHDYPSDIQEEYFKTHERIPAKALSTPVLIKKCSALLLCAVLLTLLVLLTGADSFREAFVASYILWLLVDWYDCFVLDWVLFANMKSMRLPGTEHMDREYHKKKYHFIRSCIGMALGLVPCLICGGIVAAL